MPNDAVSVSLVRGIEHGRAARQNGRGFPEVNHRRGEQTDAGMAMLLVVLMEELLAEGAAVLDATEMIWELRTVFQRAELAFRIRGCRRKRKAGCASW